MVFGIVFAAALQDMLPAWGGVKPPFVMAAVTFVAFHASLATALGFGFGAGILLDSLSGVNAFCATVSMPLVALAVHFLHGSMDEVPNSVAGAFAAAAAGGFGEVWLAVSGTAAEDAGMLARVMDAAILAVPIGAVLFASLPWLGRHIGLEAEEEQ